MVLAALVTAWRLAIWPTSRSPLSVKPTTVGVVRPPSLFGMICTAPPSRTETQQLVVPKSIPIAFPIDSGSERFWTALLARCDFHKSGTNKLVAETIARDYFLHDCVRLIVVGCFGDDSLMNVRIKMFTNSGNRLDA